VSRELAASSSDDSDDDGLLKTSKGKGKGKEKATGSDVDTEEEDEEAAFAKQQMDELRSASQIQLDLVGDDQDAEYVFAPFVVPIFCPLSVSRTCGR
jgi:hypothetical protein